MKHEQYEDEAGQAEKEPQRRTKKRARRKPTLGRQTEHGQPAERLTDQNTPAGLRQQPAQPTAESWHGSGRIGRPETTQCPPGWCCACLLERSWSRALLACCSPCDFYFYLLSVVCSAPSGVPGKRGRGRPWRAAQEQQTKTKSKTNPRKDEQAGQKRNRKRRTSLSPTNAKKKSSNGLGVADIDTF